jgi:hypothetical protein
MGTSSAASSGRRFVPTASTLLVLLVAAAVAVGVYALVNPNHLNFAAPWPVISEIVAAGAAVVLAGGIASTRRGRGTALVVWGVLLALVALALLAVVAFALSFNGA